MRLWLVLAFSYALLQVAFNLAALNRIDLRLAWFEQALLVPLGQSAVYWWIARRARRGGAASPPP